jgi:hypothetical protein
VATAIGVGIKVAWTDDELTAAIDRASLPVRWFPTREEAAERHLRMAGLSRLVQPSEPWTDVLMVALPSSLASRPT